MPNRASDLVLTRLIAPGYAPGFLTSPAAVADAALPPGFTLLEVIYGTDFKGLPGQTVTPYGTVSTGPDGQTYVALRGTDSAEEWLSDGWAVPEPWPFAATGGRTHKGFTDVYQTLTAGGQPLQGYLEALGGLIVVTGHSLGAALANLLAAALGWGMWPSATGWTIGWRPSGGTSSSATWSRTFPRRPWGTPTPGLRSSSTRPGSSP